MQTTEFDGETYNDDRLFVIAICKCKVADADGGMVETVIHHENPPADHLWAVVTFRNTRRYPIVRIDHFARSDSAQAYLRTVEPQAPLISLGGASPRVPMSFDKYTAWKVANNYEDYDYRKVFSPNGTNPCELLITPGPVCIR
jgi:hypothetical protein